MQKWGWSHVKVCIGYPEVIQHLKNNPFAYVMVVVEKTYNRASEDKLLRLLLDTHPRMPIVIRSKRKRKPKQFGKVTFLPKWFTFDGLVDVMETIYRDEVLQFQLSTGFSEKKLIEREAKLNRRAAGAKVLPFRNNA